MTRVRVWPLRGQVWRALSKRAVRVGVALCLAAGPLAAPLSAGPAAPGDGAWEDVRLPGGVEAVAQAAGMAPPADRSLFLVELVRRLHGTPNVSDPAVVSARTRVAKALGGGAAADTVPLRLPASFWSAAVFGGRVPPADVAAAILTDRRAALFYHGAAALDPETAAWLTAAPARGAAIFAPHAELFGAFGRSVHVHDGRVVTPGGDAAAEIWQSLVGASPATPDKFIDQLFARDGGRRAWLYDVVAHLPPDVQRHVLDGGRLRALADVFARAAPTWRIADRPLWRPLADPAVWLAELRVRPDGALAGPLTAAFVDAAFAADGEAPRPDTVTTLAGEPLDAGPLAARVFLSDPSKARERAALTLFAQRVFDTTPPASLGDALVVCRAMLRAPALALSLERMGAANAGVLAAIVRLADDVTHRGSPSALLSLESSLALVEGIRLSRAIDAAAAERLLDTLAKVPFFEPRAHEPLARWIRDSVVPAFAPGGDDASLEARVLDALAGRVPPRPSDASPRIEWEGQRYLVDARGAERARLTAVRGAQGGLSLDDAVSLALAAEGLITPDATNVASAARALEQAVPADVAPNANGRPGAAPIDASTRQMARTIAEARDTLRQAGAAGDFRGVPRLAHTLAPVSARLLAETLTALAYAAVVPSGEALTENARLSGRHDLGTALPTPDARIRTPWTFAEPVSGGGGPWRLRGSLLGLDLALAPQRLRRLSDEPPRPTLHGADRDAIVAAVPLVNPFDLDDPSRDAVVAAMTRGVARLAAIGAGDGRAEATREAARAAGLSEWRVEALSRPGRSGELADAFSLTERFWLGAPDAAQTTAGDRWGVALMPLTGQLGTRLPRARAWEELAGHWGGGLLAGQMADLNLRVAQQLAELSLPAELARDVLAVAVQDLLDRVAVASPDDHDALITWVRTLPRSRFEDYVAALTVDGPLRPTPDEEQP